MTEKHAKSLLSDLHEVWSDQHRFDVWRDVQAAVVEAWREFDPGRFPVVDADLIRAACVLPIEVEREERITHHDVVAFNNVLMRKVSDAGGPATANAIHFGMTSSDLVDTSTCILLREAGLLLVSALQMTGFAYLANRVVEAVDEVSVGMFSGPVGTHSSLPPEVEVTACRILDLDVEGATTQVIGRDRHAAYVSNLALAASNIGRHRPHTAHLAAVIRGYAATAWSNVVLWHERDISHSGAERIILPGATLLLAEMLEATHAP